MPRKPHLIAATLCFGWAPACASPAPSPCACAPTPCSTHARPACQWRGAPFCRGVTPIPLCSAGGVSWVVRRCRRSGVPRRARCPVEAVLALGLWQGLAQAVRVLFDSPRPLSCQVSPRALPALESGSARARGAPCVSWRLRAPAAASGDLCRAAEGAGARRQRSRTPGHFWSIWLRPRRLAPAAPGRIPVGSGLGERLAPREQP